MNTPPQNLHALIERYATDVNTNTFFEPSDETEQKESDSEEHYKKIEKVIKNPKFRAIVESNRQSSDSEQTSAPRSYTKPSYGKSEAWQRYEEIMKEVIDILTGGHGLGDILYELVDGNSDGIIGDKEFQNFLEAILLAPFATDFSDNELHRLVGFLLLVDKLQDKIEDLNMSIKEYILLLLLSSVGEDKAVSLLMNILSAQFEMSLLEEEILNQDNLLLLLLMAFFDSRRKGDSVQGVDALLDFLSALLLEGALSEGELSNFLDDLKTFLLEKLSGQELTLDLLLSSDVLLLLIAYLEDAGLLKKAPTQDVETPVGMPKELSRSLV